ncbi:MAG: UDP-N-acetylmuramoyl-L-alanyl-D-glutamate--2,6-diaminopimelate ligase, partial [Prevotellaceae bacterium]|nr:UDP-N-acetylmuramoyl-L-alanyl-D-glutamate--2,6-diaminopimelate ligase [Candidatus Colivivens equi]
IRKGFSESGLAKVAFIPDRKEAIITSILSASANAVILLAGKGHERFLIDGKNSIPFSEKEIMKEAFNIIYNT